MINVNRTMEIAYKGYTYQFRYSNANAAFKDNPDEENRIFNKYVRQLDEDLTPMFEEKKIMDINGNSVGWVRKVRANGY